MTRRAGVPTLLSITSRGTHGTAHGGPRFRGEERKGGGRGYLSLQGSAGHDIRTDDCSTVACAPRTCACTCSRSTTNTSITESRLETLLQLIDTEKAALYHIPHVLSSSSFHSDILVIARVLIEGFCRCCNADAFTSTCPVCFARVCSSVRQNFARTDSSAAVYVSVSLFGRLAFTVAPRIAEKHLTLDGCGATA